MDKTDTYIYISCLFCPVRHGGRSLICAEFVIVGSHQRRLQLMCYYGQPLHAQSRTLIRIESWKTFQTRSRSH